MAGGPPPSVRAYGAASPSGTTVKPASQPNSTRTRSAGAPKMVAAPAQVISRAGRLAGKLGGGVGRGRTQQARMPAERLNDSESRASARYGPSAATRPPPASSPAIWPSWTVCCPMAEPVGCMPRGSTSDSSAARAAANGLPSSMVAKNSVANAGIGIPGSAISATSPARARSKMIMICWRGKACARSASAGPPTMDGR